MKTHVDSIYTKADRFAIITKKCIKNGNIARAKKCLLIADKLFEEGNQETKNVLSIIFIYSVSIN